MWHISFFGGTFFRTSAAIGRYTYMIVEEVIIVCDKNQF